MPDFILQLRRICSGTSRTDVHIIAGADCFFLFLNLRSIEFGDGTLDRLDGLVLVHRLDVHGDDLAGIHLQKVLQQLVTEVGGGDGEKTHGPIQPAHLETAAVLEGKHGGGNGVLDREAAPGKGVPVKLEFLPAVHVEDVVHELEPFFAVEGFCGHAQPVEIVEQVVLDVFQPGLGQLHAVRLDAEGDELGLGQAVVAFGQLLTQHLAVLGPNVIKAVLLERDTDAALKVSGIGGDVYKRQLKMDRAVEEIEEGAPFLKDRRLVLLLGQLVVDVLKLDGAGVVVGAHPASPVLEHPLERDGLLGRPGRSRRLALVDCGLNLLILLGRQGISLFLSRKGKQSHRPPVPAPPAAGAERSSLRCGRAAPWGG